MGNVHKIKLNDHFFMDVASGKKSFELRKNDRYYKVGDLLYLLEYDGVHYIGGEIVAEVVYMLTAGDVPGLQSGYVILGIKIHQVKMPFCNNSIKEQLNQIKRKLKNSPYIFRRKK